MRKALMSAAVLSALLAAVTGCTNFDAAATSPVSEECKGAIAQQRELWASDTSSDGQLHEAELRGLQECKNIDEWSTAVSYDPGSMGYEVLSTEDAANLVYMPCQSSDPENQTAVCADAAIRRYLD